MKRNKKPYKILSLLKNDTNLVETLQYQDVI